jgi:hypothetical protein
MNTSLTLALNQQPAQLSQHFAHAGGWEKLGWQTVDIEIDVDDIVMMEEGEGGLFS